MKKRVPLRLAAAAAVLLHCQSLVALHVTDGHCSALPIVLNTWGFSNATLRAWEVLTAENGTALDAVEQGCSQCERDQCDGTVGYGGSPDEEGETTLDALIIDGPTYSMGAVGDLRRVKRAISVARAVMERSTHTFLVGEKATQFAVEMGFKEESLATNHSKQMWSDWQASNCQPNYRQNVVPDPRTSCGPYKPAPRLFEHRRGCPSAASELNHDTIGMVAIDGHKRLAAGTSTNGMNHKIPGRIGDSPIPGAGAFADQEVGGAAATGDGDILMRYLPRCDNALAFSFHAVESMRRGMDPGSACIAALRYIVRHHPRFVGGMVAVSIDGTYGAACHGIPKFPYSVAKPEYGTVVVEHVECSN